MIGRKIISDFGNNFKEMKTPLHEGEGVTIACSNKHDLIIGYRAVCLQGIENV